MSCIHAELGLPGMQGEYGPVAVVLKGDKPSGHYCGISKLVDNAPIIFFYFFAAAAAAATAVKYIHSKVTYKWPHARSSCHHRCRRAGWFLWTNTTPIKKCKGAVGIFYIIANDGIIEENTVRSICSDGETQAIWV